MHLNVCPTKKEKQINSINHQISFNEYKIWNIHQSWLQYLWNHSWQSLCLTLDPIDLMSTVWFPTESAVQYRTNDICKPSVSNKQTEFFILNVEMSLCSIAVKIVVGRFLTYFVYVVQHILPFWFYQRIPCDIWKAMLEYHSGTPMTVWLCHISGPCVRSMRTHDSPSKDQRKQHFSSELHYIDSIRLNGIHTH